MTRLLLLVAGAAASRSSPPDPLLPPTATVEVGHRPAGAQEATTELLSRREPPSLSSPNGRTAVYASRAEYDEALKVFRGIGLTPAQSARRCSEARALGKDLSHEGREVLPDGKWCFHHNDRLDECPHLRTAGGKVCDFFPAPEGDAEWIKSITQAISNSESEGARCITVNACPPAPPRRCLSWGDPHIVTSFGTWSEAKSAKYDSMGLGVFELAADASAAVHTFHCPWPYGGFFAKKGAPASAAASVGVAARIGPHRLTIANARLLVNGTELDGALPVTFADGTKIEAAGSLCKKAGKCTLAGWSIVRGTATLAVSTYAAPPGAPADYFHSIRIEMPPALAKAAKGACGAKDAATARPGGDGSLFDANVEASLRKMCGLQPASAGPAVAVPGGPADGYDPAVGAEQACEKTGGNLEEARSACALLLGIDNDACAAAPAPASVPSPGPLPPPFRRLLRPPLPPPPPSASTAASTTRARRATSAPPSTRASAASSRRLTTAAPRRRRRRRRTTPPTAAARSTASASRRPAPRASRRRPSRITFWRASPRATRAPTRSTWRRGAT